MSTAQTILEIILTGLLSYKIYLVHKFKASIDSRLDILEEFTKWLKVDLNIERLGEKLKFMEQMRIDSGIAQGNHMKYVEARIYALECFRELQVQKQTIATQAVEVIGRRFDENDYDSTGL